MSGITLYYYDDKRICGHWQVVDRLAIFQQLQANRE
jgi:predicted ester cyclase